MDGAVNDVTQTETLPQRLRNREAIKDCFESARAKAARRLLKATDVDSSSNLGNKRNNSAAVLKLLSYSDGIQLADGVYRQRRGKMKIVSKVRKLARLTLRARIGAAFAKIAGAVDPRTAQRRTNDFYRSSGAGWTRSLN